MVEGFSEAEVAALINGNPLAYVYEIRKTSIPYDKGMPIEIYLANMGPMVCRVFPADHRLCYHVVVLNETQFDLYDGGYPDSLALELRGRFDITVTDLTVRDARLLCMRRAICRVACIAVIRCYHIRLRDLRVLVARALWETRAQSEWYDEEWPK